MGRTPTLRRRLLAAAAAAAAVLGACGPPGGSARLVEEPAAAAPTTGVPAPPPLEPPPSSEVATTAAPEPAAPAPVATAAAPVATAPPARRREVKAPPPRPNRAREAATRSEPPAAPPPDPTAPAPPPSTARHPQDFPDPFVFRAGAFWYALSTQRGLTKVPVLRSPDLVHWEDRGDALAALPRWSRFGALWAPSVLALPAGFALYYSTTDEATGLQCLSSAFSAVPDGPYVDASTAPFLCQTERGGSIDPSPFRDAGGRPWLAWKSEGTTDGEPTRIWSQALSDDGRTLLGEPHELLATAQAWEGPIVEAPSVFVDAGRYHLLYSGNRWETSAYAIGHAVCDGPAGPCRRTAAAPVGPQHPSEAGAGGGEAFRDVDGSLRVAYHAWDPVRVGYPDGLRRLRIGALRLEPEGRAVVEPMPA